MIIRNSITILIVSLSINGLYASDDQIEKSSQNNTIQDVSLVLSDAGLDISVGLIKKTVYESKDKSCALKFGSSLSIMKMLQGKMSISDLVGPSFDFETSMLGCDQKLGFKLKLFSLFGYAKMFHSMKLPKNMNELLSTMSEKFNLYIKKSDKSVASAFLLYLWLNHCGGAAKFIKGNDEDEKVIKKRMIFSAVLGLMLRYGMKNFDTSTLAKIATMTSALCAAFTVAPNALLNRITSIV